jgi:cysteine synthase A
MPDDQATEKSDLLRVLGATVERVKPVSIVNADHYVNQARAIAAQLNAEQTAAAAGTSEAEASPSAPRAFFADQIETESIFTAQFTSTGPEIWRQTRGKVKVHLCLYVFEFMH